MGRGGFAGEFGASHYNQWGTLLHSCVEVHKPIELSLGMVSGVGRRMGVLDGGPRAPRGRAVSWSFNRNVFNSCVKS